MSRNPKLEAFLLARYEAETCGRGEREARWATVNSMAKTLIASSQEKNLSIFELIAATTPEYRSFKAERIREQRQRLSRLR